MNGCFASRQHRGRAIRRMRSLLAAAVCAAGCLAAQDLDLVLYAGDPAKRTTLEQIKDPDECAAFDELKSEKDPARKRALAETFLETYPQS